MAPRVLSSIWPPPMPQHIVQRLQRRERRRDATARLQAVARGMAARRAARAARAAQQAVGASSHWILPSDPAVGSCRRRLAAGRRRRDDGERGGSVSTQPGPLDAIPPAEDPDAPSNKYIHV